MTAVQSHADLIVRAEEHASTHTESAELIGQLVAALVELSCLAVETARAKALAVRPVGLGVLGGRASG